MPKPLPPIRAREAKAAVLATGLDNATLVRIAALYGQDMDPIDAILANLGVGQMSADTRFEDYLATLAPAKRSRAKKTLTTLMPCRDGEHARHVLIERMIDEGATLKEMTPVGIDYAGYLLNLIEVLSDEALKPGE